MIEIADIIVRKANTCFGKTFHTIPDMRSGMQMVDGVIIRFRRFGPSVTIYVAFRLTLQTLANLRDKCCLTYLCRSSFVFIIIIGSFRKKHGQNMRISPKSGFLLAEAFLRCWLRQHRQYSFAKRPNVPGVGVCSRSVLGVLSKLNPGENALRQGFYIKTRSLYSCPCFRSPCSNGRSHVNFFKIVTKIYGPAQDHY